MKKLAVGKDVAYVSLFTALAVVCSWIYIPTPVPFTLQTFALLSAVCFLGAKRGFLVACSYLAIGFIGVPVFSGFQGGFAALFGSTGGYLIGYFVGGLLMCFVSLIPVKKGKKLLTLCVGQLTYYVCGVAWYCLVYVQGTVGFFAALLVCVLPFLLPDAAKIVLALYLSKKLARLTLKDRKIPHVKNAVYLLSVADLDKESFEKWYEKMPKPRQDKIDALQFDEDKKRSLAAGVLLYTAAKNYGLNFADMRVKEGGKPYFEKEKFFFSLSHSGDYAVLAISQKEVGVDVERVREFSVRALEKAFTDKEKSYAKEGDMDLRLTTLWTMKESAAKYIGTGLKGSPKSVEVDAKSLRVLGDGYEKLRFTTYQVAGYALTVCAQKTPFTKGLTPFYITTK